MHYLLKIDGMGCKRCVQRVNDALAAAGAKELNVEKTPDTMCFR